MKQKFEVEARSVIRSSLLALAAAVALAWCPAASADLADETALAEAYAPVVRLVEQPEECGPGEPYLPIDVEILFDEPTVALRGPWGDDLIEVGPSARDLARGLYEYHLDFPGNALDPGCRYEQWARRVSEGTTPTVYAHVATDPGYPDQLSLQYWLFYVFNDWNNLHEGDWEMIQLVFEAGDASQALSREPTSIGYSQHQGAERATWGEEKLELVDGRHPVVPSRRRLARELLRGGALPGEFGRAGCRLRRHDWADLRRASGRPDDPERS
jgi:hypothetical protein